MKTAVPRAYVWSGLVLIGLSAVACSGSESNAGSPATTPTTIHSSRPQPPPPDPETPTVSHDPYPALCRRIALPDAQKLFVKPLGPMTTGGSSDCQFTPRGSVSDVNTLKVYLRLRDGDKTLFNHVGDIPYGDFTPLTGLGYQAKWASQGFVPVTVVDVRDGSFTCTVIPPANAAVTTLARPGGATDQPVARATATAFAKDLGVICRDIFTAHS